MRFIHTADWHLGRIFYERYLTEDQAYVLAQFLELVRDVRPDAVVIAGDLYDRAVPPAQAVALLDDVLTELAAMRVPVVAISGNHDSTERVEFGARLMATGGVHLYGMARPDTAPLVLHDAAGPVYICPFAFADPATVRIEFGAESVRDYATLFAAQHARLRAQVPAGSRSVAVAHAFVAGGEESASERPLSVGGSSQVPWTTFAEYDYTMLGHLHRPQQVGQPHIRYSGSLLKYSFDEAEHRKGIDIVELAADGSATRESVALRPKYDMRILTGSFAELIGEGTPSCEDYLLVRLTDEGPVLDAMGRLRDKFPQILGIEPIGLAAPTASRERADLRRVGQEELFNTFAERLGGRPLNEAETAVMAEVWRELREEDER